MEAGRAGDDRIEKSWNMPNGWVIVQTAEQVERSLLLDEGSRPGAYSFLATAPDAYFALQRCNLPARSTHEFASREDLDRIAWQNYDRVQEATKNLNEWLRSQIPELPENFKPFDALKYQMKHLTDSIAFTLKELGEFFRTESPAELRYWSNKRGMDGGDKLRAAELGKMADFSLLPPDETVASLVLGTPFWLERFGVWPKRLFIPFSANTESRQLDRCRRIFKRLLNPNRVSALRSGIVRASVGARGQRLLIVGIADNVLSFIRYTQARHRTHVDWWTYYACNPIHLSTLTQVPLYGSTDGILKVIAQAAEQSHAFEPRILWECGGDEQLVRDILWERLVQFWRRRVPHLLLLYIRAIRYFEKYRPLAVICGTTSSDEIQIIRQAAEVCAVPFVSFQHGGGCGYIQTEWIKLSDLQAGLYAGYGLEGCRSLKKFAATQGLATGMVSIGWVRGSQLAIQTGDSSSKGRTKINLQIMPQAIHKLVYVPTGLVGDYRYGPYHDVHDTEYCLQQVEVIRALSRLPDTCVLVNIHYKDRNKNPLEQWVQQQNNRRIGVPRPGRLFTLLPAVDVVVLDSPMTTLIEAMAAGKWVVYLNTGIYRWTTEGEDLMRKTVVWVDKSHGWEECLRNAIIDSFKKPALDPTRNAFLAAYGSLEFRPDRLWDTLLSLRKRS